jgi:hypothetical protein
MGGLMKMKKALIFLILIGLPILILAAGETEGADFTKQREGALLNAPQSPAASTGLQADENQPRLMPKLLKSKAEADASPAAGNLPEKRAKYKPYVAGEGEKKNK